MSINPNDPPNPGAAPHPGVAPDPNRTVIMPQASIPSFAPQGAPAPHQPSAAPQWSASTPESHVLNSPPTFGAGPTGAAVSTAGKSPAAFGLFAAAALTVLAMFLPLIVVLDKSASVFSAAKGTFVFYLVCAGLMVVVALVSKKALHILSLLIGLAVVALALNYRSDASTLGVTAGAGIWALLVGGLVCLGASILGLIRTA